MKQIRQKGEIREDGMVFVKYRWRSTSEGRKQYEWWRHPEWKDRDSAKSRDYSQRNPEKVAAYVAKAKLAPGYAKRNFDRVKKWRKNNPDRVREWYRNWTKKRRASDPKIAITYRLYARVNQAIHGRNKSAKTAELLGCSIDDLKQHLEALFLPGMSWENRSLWHVDHIRPIASFDLLDSEQQRCCFHFSNLQPLWAKDNESKGARVQ